MKKFLLFISFCCLSATGFATTYINITNTDLNVASNWTSDGTIAGTAAPNFTTNLDVFNLDNDPGVQAWVGTFTLGAAASTVTLNINFTGSPVVFSGNLAIVKATSSLTTAAGATLDMATFTLANAGTFANSGTIRTAATGALPLPTAKTWLGAGTVEYYGTSSQTIVAGTYSGNVTISGNRGIQTLTFAAGTVSIGATLTFSATGSPLFTMTGNTITYANVTGGLTISSAIPYNNLTLGNTGNTNTPDGNITVAAALQATGGAGGTLDMGTNTLSVGTAVVTNTGIILTSNMSAFPLSTGKTWGGTVKYAAAGGGQTIASGTYATLTLLNSTSSDNAGGAITVNTALNTTSGGTFDMGTFLLAGTLTTVTNPGTIRTAASGATPVTTGKTWGSAAGTFEYYGTSSQTIVAGTYTNNLTISGDRTGQTLTFANGTIILSNALTYTATGSPTSITTSNTITYAKLTGGLTISSAIPYNNLNLNNTSGTNTADGALAIAGILNLGSAAAGTFANGGFNHTLAGNLTGSGTQTGVGKITMTGNNATINFTGVCGNLELNSTGFSLAANSTFNGVVTFTAGKLNLNAKTLTIAGAATSFPSMSAANCFTGSATSNMTVTATSNIGTIYFDQATPGGNQLSTFTISGIGGTTTLAASNPIAVTTLTLTAGTLADGGNTITLTGNLSGVGTHTGTGKIYMTGNPASISFTGNSGNLELDNVLGFSLAGNSTINGPLTCTNGKLALLNRTLTIGIGGTVSGMSAANSITGNGALSSLVITATANVGTLFFDQGTPGTTDNIGALTLTPAGAAMTLGSNISILTTLALTAATSSINDGGFIITNAGAITGAGVHTSTGSGKILMTGANKSIGTTVTLGNIELNSVGTSAFTLGGAVTINGALTFTGAANTLTIGANVLTLKGTVSGMSATQYFTGSATSNMTIGSTGALGVVFFNQTTPGTATTVGTTNNIATFTVNTGASVTLGSDLSISTSLALVGTGAIADGGFLIKDNGSITGTGTHTSTGSGKISVIGLNSSIANGAATYGNFEFNHLVASAFTMAGSPTITGTLTYTGAANTLTLGANTLTLNGTVAGMSATQFFTGSATSNLTLTNSGAVGTLFFGAAGAANTIQNFRMTGGGTVTLGNSMISGTLLDLASTGTGGSIALSPAITLTLGGTFSTSATKFITADPTSLINVTSTSPAAGTLFFDPVANTFASLTITGLLGITTLGTDISIGTLALTGVSGALADGGKIITLTGNITGTGIHTSTAGGKILMTGSAKTISAATLGNLELNSGVATAFSLTGGPTITGLLNFAGANNTLTLGAFILTLKGTVAGMSSTEYLTGSASSNITVNTAGSLGTIYLNPGTPATTNKIVTFTILGGGNATMGNDMNVTTLALTSGKLAVGAGNLLTLTGALTGASASNYLIGSATSKLNTGTSSTYFFDQTTPGTSNNFSIITLITATTTTLGNALSVGALNFALAGILADGGNTVTCTGNITGTGTHSGLGKISMTGNGATISTITPGNLDINPGAGNSVGMSAALTTNAAFTFSGGKFAIGANTLTLGIGTAITGMSAANSITGNGASSNLTITKTGSVGTIFFDQTTPGTTDNIATLTLTPAASAMTLGSNVSILTSLALTNATSTINDGGFTISNAGNIVGAGVHTSTGAGKILMTGVGKTIAALTLGNIEINSALTSAFALAGSLTINGALTFTGVNNTLTIGVNTLTLKGTVAGMSATEYFTGSVSSNITVNTAGSLGTIYLNPGTPATTNKIATFTMLGGGNAAMGNDMNVTALALTSGKLAIGAGNLLTLTGALTGASASNYLIGSASSKLNTGTSSTYFFDQTTPGTSNNFSIMTLTTGTTTTLGNALSVGALNFAVAGILADGGNTVTCTGNITGTGTHSGLGKISMTGNGATISAITPGNLDINPGAGNSVGLSGLLTTNAAFTFSGGKFAIGASTLTLGVGTAITGMSAANSITGNGASSNLTITNTGNVGTLFFDQTTPGTTDNIATLTLTPAASAMTLGSNVSIQTSLTLTNAASTLNDGGFIITNAGNIAGAGVHTSTGVGKIVMTGLNKSIGTTATLGNIELNDVATSAFVLGGAVTINGALTFTGANNTLTVGATTLTLNGTVANMSATKFITGSATSNMTIGATGALGTLFLNQGTPGTTNNFATFTINGAGGTTTLGNNLAVGAALALTASTGTLADNGKTITLSGNITGTGTHTSTGAGGIIMAVINKTISGATLGNLSFNNLASTFTLTGSPVVNGVLTYVGGASTTKLSVGANTLTLNGTVAGMSASKLVIGSATSNLTLGNTGALGTLFFDQGTPGTTNNFATLTVGGIGGTATLGNAATVGTTLALTAGTLAAGVNTITLAGNITGTGTHSSSGAGVISMTAPVSATISGATLGSLTLNNAARYALTGDPVINGTLLLTTGIFDIAAQNLTFGPSAIFSGVPSSSNMLYSSSVTPGQVRRQFTVNGSFAFPIGDGTPIYSPITLNFTGGSYAAGAYAGINVTKAANSHNANTSNFISRYWTVGTSNITGPIYQVTSASYAAGDVTPTESNMVMGGYTGSLPWIKLTGSSVNTGTHTISATGTLTSSNVEITGLSSFGPTVSIHNPSSSTIICNGGTLQLDANAVGDASFTYNWLPATGLSGTTGSTVFAAPITNTIYTVTVTDGNGVTATDTYTVTVTPAVTASTSNDGPICNGGTISLNANPGGAASVYSWSGPNLSSSTVSNPTATPTTTAIYSVTVSDGTVHPGCVLNLTSTITVNAAITAAPVNSGPICLGNSVTLTAAPSGGVTTYAWTGPNLSSASVQNPTATPIVTSTYSLTVAGGAAPGCSPVNVYTTQVTVTSMPSISAIGNNAPICAGSALNLTSTASSGTAPYAFSWAGPASYTAVIQNPSIAGATTAASGTYTLTVTDANGCNATGVNTTSGTVNPEPAISFIGNNTPLCSVTTTLNLSATASGGTGSLSYAWAGPNSFTSALQNPAIPAVTTAVTGIYTLTVTDANSCIATGTNTTTTTVNPSPVLGVINGADGLCVGGTITLTDTTAGGVWSISSGVATIGAGTGLVTGISMSGGIVTYSATNGFSCTSVVTKTIQVEGVAGNIYTFAGTGIAGNTGNGAAAYLATILGPRAMATDINGNLYICDVGNQNVRKISTTGIITRVAGNGTAGNTGDGGQATAATLNAPNGIYVDAAGNIFISNTNSHTIRKVNTSGIISTIAGTASVSGFSGDNGPASAAKLYSPLGLCGDAAGNLYITDEANHRIRKIDGATGLITTIAGTGYDAYSGDGGQATAAAFSFPRSVCLDNSGNLYISDGENAVIRKIVLSTGIISTFAGTGTLGYSGDGGPATAAQFQATTHMAFDGGSMLYIADQANIRVRQINLSTNVVSTLVGTGTVGFSGDGGLASSATTAAPAGVACDKQGNFYFSDFRSRRIRVIPSTGSVAITLAGPTSVATGTPITFTVSAYSTNDVTYQWQKNGVNVGSGGTTYTNSSPIDGDVYTCILTVTPDCGTVFTLTSNSITVNVYGPRPIEPASVKEEIIAHGLTLFPNPVHDLLNIAGTNFANGTAYITIYDQVTRIMLTQTATVNNGKLSAKLDLQFLANGLYIISITDYDQKIALSKFIKN